MDEMLTTLLRRFKARDWSIEYLDVKDMLLEVARSGVEFDDLRFAYVTVHIDRVLWTQIMHWQKGFEQGNNK